MNKLEHRYARYQTTSIEVIATEIAKSFIESGCTDDCIPEYSVEMAKRIIRLCGEYKESENKDENNFGKSD